MLLCAVALAALPTCAASAHETPDPTIVHNARDGVVRLYGAGGPDTALRKVAAVFHQETGIDVVITAGPEPTWSKHAQADADIVWGTSEEEITALLETYKDFASSDVMPVYLRPAIIAVKKGNPKHIAGFDDLLKDGMRVVVTEGAGVANTSGTGVWEDVAGRLGHLSDVATLRRHIIAFGKGSGASYKAFVEQDADAWITWPDWPITHADKADLVPLAPSRTIWRDLNLVMAPDADPQAHRFIAFLMSARGAAIMQTEGWTR